MLLPIVASAPVFYSLFCCKEFFTPVTFAPYIPLLLIFTVLPSSIAILILASTYQQSRGTIKATKNIASKLILGYAVSAAVAAIAFSYSQSSGLPEMVNQRNLYLYYNHPLVLPTEALKYPDTEYGLEAKLEAARKSIDSCRNSNDVLALANQVIESKAKKRPEVLSTAYFYKLQAKNWQQQATTKDIDNALDAIEKLPDTVRTTVTIDPLPLEANTPIYRHAIAVP